MKILVVLIALLALAPAVAGMGDTPPEIDSGVDYNVLNPGFIPNAGQYEPGVDYILQSQGATIFFTRNELVLTHASGDVIRQSFAGASPGVNLTAGDQRPGVVNYYVGNDSSKWVSDIPVYANIVYEGLYPRIDLVYTGKDGRLKREFRVSAGADPSQIEIIYEGTSAPCVDEDGVLRFASPAGEMLESPLICWQVIDGERIDRVAEYIVDCGSIYIDISEYDAGHELIIDPELVYSSYLGGSDNEYGSAIVDDGAGGVWVTGRTQSTDFPIQEGDQGSFGGGDEDAFISHFSSSGALISSTFLGGGGWDRGCILAADGAGGVWVVGGTSSTDFPVINPYQDNLVGDWYTFVAHFSSSGLLTSSTCLGGGTGGDGNIRYDLASDDSGGVWVMGRTNTIYLPVQNAHQDTFGGGTDLFVAHFALNGTLLSSTYLGGGDDDIGWALAGDGSGGVWVTGYTSSADFPIQNEHQESFGGGDHDAFVARFASNGTLLSSTYLGGESDDIGYFLACDGAGGIWVAGHTRSTDFPVKDAYQDTFGGGADLFVARFLSSGALFSSTYLGGKDWDYGYALVDDDAGGIWVAGHTQSTDFPVKNASQNDYGGVGDAFVARFSPAGNILSSTYLGGGDDDIGYALAGDGGGGVWVIGHTQSTDFPVKRAYQNDYGGGGNDVFVAHLVSSGALLSSTYLGGEGWDYGTDLAGDGAGGVWVMGTTPSTDFPVKRAYQSASGGGHDVFIAKFGSGVLAHPNAEFTFNANYNRYTLSDRIASGTSSCRLAYIASVHNLLENPENISGNLSFTLDASEIADISSEEYAEINGTQVTWTFPQETVISPGTALSTQAATSTLVTRRSDMTLERSCNRTDFTGAGVQQATLNMTLDATDLDNLWGRIECYETGDVQARFVPDTISTDLPLRDLSQEPARIQFTADRFKLEAGRQYTLSCAVEVTPLRPVAYAPACVVWEIQNSTSMAAPAGAQVALPADLLLQGVNAARFSSDTSCKWTCVHNDHVVTSIHQRATQVSAPVADFTANVTAGVAPLVVKFTDTSIGDLTSWFWDFGDGATSTDQNSVHTYRKPGNYTVNLTVSTAEGPASLSRPAYIAVTAQKGDLNGDSTIDIGDVAKVAYMVVGKEPADLAADFNGNGRVDIGDAAKIAYFFVGKIDAL